MTAALIAYSHTQVTFIADINNLVRENGQESCMMVKAKSPKVKCYRISKKDFVHFLEDQYPGVLVQLLDVYVLPQIDINRFPGPDGDNGNWIDGHRRLYDQ